MGRPMLDVQRRQFITLLGGAMAAWPLAARAQQPAMPVIGFLSSLSLAPSAHLIAAFRRGIAETGFVEGQNLAIEYRWADGRLVQLADLAADLVRRRVSVIAAPGVGALAAKATTQTVPIVFGVSEDPVKLGLVASLARPGGNLTGINFFVAELVAKRLGLLRELVPAASRVAVLVNPANVQTASATLSEAEPAARALGLQIQVFTASSNREIDTAYAALARERPNALFVAPDALFVNRRVQLIALAARHALPATYAVREYVEAGGLMSYGTSVADMYRQIGVYTGRVLKGAKPADLPVMQATKFELVINLQTARLLEIEVPPTLLARADEVIE
jgi:putative tryptophan/tyrosine transport system substrate-binding protein